MSCHKCEHGMSDRSDENQRRTDPIQVLKGSKLYCSVWKDTDHLSCISFVQTKKSFRLNYLVHPTPDTCQN